MTEKRYLVYRSWNGQTHVSIDYGEHETGEGVKKDHSILKKFEIKNPVITNLEILKKLYPYEVNENDQI